jgi:hypothetical protein
MINDIKPKADSKPWINPMIATKMFPQYDYWIQKAVHIMLQPKLANLREKYKLKYITIKADNTNTIVNMRQVPRKGFLISQSVPAND